MQIWIPLIILSIVLAPALSFINALGSSQSYIIVDMSLSIMLSIGIIYAVYKVTEISQEDRFGQLVSIWIVFLIAAAASILISHPLSYLASINPSAASNSMIQGLMLQNSNLLAYLMTFCIIFVFFILLFYLILAFNFDTFFPFICVLLITGLYLEYAQVALLGAADVVLVSSTAFLIVFAIYGGLPEKEKASMRQITLNPEKSAIIYALALATFFLTYLIVHTASPSGVSLLDASLELVNIVALAIMLFVVTFLCSLFWTKDAIVKWYDSGQKRV
jgi:hypothetical protein